jgi:hypothetical protein
MDLQELNPTALSQVIRLGILTNPVITYGLNS